VTFLVYGVIGVVLFVGLVQAHGRLILRRTPPVPHLLALWLLGAAAVFAAVLVGEASRPVVLSALNLAVYLCLGEIYLFFYAAAIGSLSVRIMVKMLELEPLPDALERAIAHYSPAMFFELRIQNLRSQRLLAEAGDRYRLTPKGCRWVRYGVFLKRLLGVGIGG